MANPEHLGWLGSAAFTWNKTFCEGQRKADLTDADLSGRDLSGFDFRCTNLEGANLRETTLRGADLRVKEGTLRTEQLAGSDLTGAQLPEPLKSLYDKLENVKGISESARKIFLGVMAGCLYCWLTIATTTDVNLITNRASSPLPIIQTSIPIVGFYVVAPLLVLCVYFYFHFYLQKLWEDLGSLPAVFSDGRPLHTKVDPWLLNDLVRSHLPKLSVGRPFLSYFQLWISVLLAWWIVPITILLFWGRYLRRHEWVGTAFHAVLLILSLMAGVSLYRLAVATLRGTERMPFAWNRVLRTHRGYQIAASCVGAGILCGLLSWGSIRGFKPFYSLFEFRNSGENWRIEYGPATWAPRLMSLVGYSPFANLEGAEVSQRKLGWDAKNYKSDTVIGADFYRANLRFIRASGAFFAAADLHSADLTGADLSGADLRHAELTNADFGGPVTFASLSVANLSGIRAFETNFTHAFLDGADLSSAELGGAKFTRAYLRDANLSGADLGDAKLDEADLKNADLTGATLTHASFMRAENLDPQMVKKATYWEYAFYDGPTLRALGLPADHNEKLQQYIQEQKETSH